MNTEEAEHIISLIGEENAEKLYNDFGSKRISFASVHKYIEVKKILLVINSKKAVQLIARQLRMARSTIYRLRKKLKNLR